MAEGRRLEHRRPRVLWAKGRSCFLYARDLSDFVDTPVFWLRNHVLDRTRGARRPLPRNVMPFQVCGKIAWIFGKVMAEYGDRFHDGVLDGSLREF
jgi:hypothetical protein